jgi:hypothetical protein
MRPDAKTGKFRLFETRRRSGAYSKPEPLPFSTGETSEFDPVVAPDRSYVLFFSTRAPSAPNTSEFFIARRGRTGWAEPALLAKGLNGIEPRLSPDRRTLYFSAPDGAASQRIWRMRTPAHAPCAAP